ncbi:MAG: class I SAM-dependent methyltransferase [Alphaproteobacteria bacterium]|nr:class I SAM-dependent methyltransferase [Alphaproteobacteria bacterium]
MDKSDYLGVADASKHWVKRVSPAGQYFELIKQVHAETDGKKLLDVGCAEGIEVVNFTKLGFKAEGVDVDGGFIQAAKTTFPNLNFTMGDAEALPYKDESFHVVFSINTLFYTDINKSIPEFIRVLETGGIGVVGFDIRIEDLDKKTTFHQESREHLKDVLKRNGAQIILLGKEESRVDETPFRHEHTFYKVVFQKQPIHFG